MFLTITIDTASKRKRTPIRFKMKKFNPALWRGPMNLKKRSLQQKLRAWARQFKQGQQYYRPAAF